MAVNGIEIKVGQVWRTRDGNTLRIKEHNPTDKFYPWKTDLVWLNDEGRPRFRRFCGYDLMMLIADEKVVIHPPPDDIRIPEPRTIFDVADINMNVQGYHTLSNVFQMAYNQAAVGKGVQRHAASGEPFHEQVMQIGAEKFGVGSLLFQAFKKSEESQRLEHDAAVKELLGAMVYLAGAVIALEKAKALK